MPDLNALARWLLLAGLALTAAGALLLLAARLGWPLGRLPGDLRFQVGGLSCFVPLATSIVLSLLLTIVLNLLARGAGR